jgi:hypothetical protein
MGMPCNRIRCTKPRKVLVKTASARGSLEGQIRKAKEKLAKARTPMMQAFFRARLQCLMEAVSHE